MAYDPRSTLTSTNFDEVPDVPLLPNGTYHVQITAQDRRTNDRTGTEWWDLTCKPISAGAGVDAAKLNGIDFEDYDLRASFPLTKRAWGRVKEFLTSMGFTARPFDDIYAERAVVGLTALATVSTGEYTSRGRTVAINNVDELVGNSQQ